MTARWRGESGTVLRPFDGRGTGADARHLKCSSELEVKPSPGYSQPVDHELTIGALSERTGAATSALRFYEAEGLIHATRSPGGQRRFARDTLRRVSFIRVAQQVGLSLDEIRTALHALPEQRTPTEKDWHKLS